MQAQQQQEGLIGRFGLEVSEVARDMVGSEGMSAPDQEVTIAPLRRLQGQCERYLRVATSGKDRFVLFFLSAFLEDVFYNLSGDVPYDPDSDQCKRRFFINLADGLERLGRALTEGDADNCSRSCEDMVASYLDTITQINDLLVTE